MAAFLKFCETQNLNEVIWFCQKSFIICFKCDFHFNNDLINKTYYFLESGGMPVKRWGGNGEKEEMKDEGLGMKDEGFRVSGKR